MNSADQLFDRLLREEHLISFIDAYEILLGNRPKWVTHQHSPKVIDIALKL
jgi:hypothetical protein